MCCVIESVNNASPASAAGIKAGDELISINHEPVLDFVDYEYLSADEKLVINIRRNGAINEYSVSKSIDRSLGIRLAEGKQSRVRHCSNKCIFCFVDQLPKGMRESLYVKDDDWRMSFSMGNYVTLSNVGDAEFERILNRHVSPLYISVHAVDPEVRKKLLGRESPILEKLNRLCANSQYFHTQAVVCPDINDGEVLSRTIDALAGMYPYAMSLAVVPVGLSGHRDGLIGLTPYDRRKAAETVKQVEAAQKICLSKFGDRFVYAADELYIKAGLDFPPFAQYNFDQLENGVGMIRMFEHEVAEALPRYRKRSRRDLTLITGVDAEPFIRKAVDTVKPSGDVKVFPVVNDFFGHSITVAGLLTGRDIAAQAGKLTHREVVIPSCMLRDGNGLFLDDMSVDDLSAALDAKVIVVNTDGEAFVKLLTT